VHKEFWNFYVEQIKRDSLAGDPYGRTADGLYWSNRVLMDAGSEVSNQNRYNPKPSPDGSPLESSALQAAFNIISRSDDGLDHFLSEYQNDPTDIDPFEVDKVSEMLVKSRLSGISRGVVPGGYLKLTAGIDVGKYYLHWVVVAWLDHFHGFVVDYGTDEVKSPRESIKISQAAALATEQAIFEALREWRAWHDQNGFMLEGSDRPVFCDIVNIDSGFMPGAVYKITRGSKTLRPVKGFGSTQRIAFREPTRPLPARYKGTGWFGKMSKTARMWLYHVDDDHWKKQVQQAFVIDPVQAGSIQLYGSTGHRHNEFAKHICAESWTTEHTPKGKRSYFIQNNRRNHFLDAIKYAAVGGSMLQLSLLESQSKDTDKKGSAA
jgi:phage terminase large subunit GpA-like protein